MKNVRRIISAICLAGVCVLFYLATASLIRSSHTYSLLITSTNLSKKMLDAIMGPVKSLTSVPGAVTKTLHGDTPKFGLGSVESEAKCKEIHTFMICCGQASIEKRRAILDRETKLKDTRNYFGRDMTQDLIYDENYFRFSDEDMEKPLHKFSHNCKLNLSFLYSSSSHLKELGNKFNLEKQP